LGNWRRFFLALSPVAAAAAVLEVVFAALEPSVVLAGAFDVVPFDAGAFSAAEAGLGAVTIDNPGQRVIGNLKFKMVPFDAGASLAGSGSGFGYHNDRQ
jgi:hypothetical protein